MDCEPRPIQATRRGSGRLEDFPWGSIEWLSNADLTPGSEMTLGRVILAAGEANSRHLHPNCHELLYVVSGSIEHELGGQIVTLDTGSVIHIPRSAPHQARNVGDRAAEMVVVYSTERREMVFVDSAAW